jgi:hypothetical protein
MGPQQREWGFLVETKKGLHRWVNHTAYLTDWKSYHEKFVTAKSKKK